MGREGEAYDAPNVYETHVGGRGYEVPAMFEARPPYKVGDVGEPIDSGGAVFSGADAHRARIPGMPAPIPQSVSGGANAHRSSNRLLPALCEIAAELLSPTRCASCECPGALICENCLESMVRIDPAYACTRCGAPFGFMLCTECQGAATSLDRCLAAAVFDGPPARIIRAYKDGGERRLAAEIAHIMLKAAFEAERTSPKCYGGIISQTDAVTFVPVTAAAYRRRGFDHMEQVARAFSGACGLPFVDVLVKHGAYDQRAFSREERLEHSRDVYEAVEPVDGARLLLLDDVITTGATMNAAASVLKRAGAASVDGLAFARVWG